ncbi:YceI family protein [Paraburkholderia sp. EG286A]|uniref:YceI family protein n=2 Tax=Paraburkholderia TaxID=1822464 RepID=UPI0034D1AA70
MPYRSPIRRRGAAMHRLKARVGAIVMFGVCAACAVAGVRADSIDTSAPLAQYRLDPGRSGVTFDVANVWHANLTMRFSRIGAQLEGFQGFAVGRVMVTIDATSLESNTPFVAGFVAGGDMLDVAHFPAIRFVSTRFVRTGTLTGLLTGDLTIRTTTCPVTLAVAFDEDPRDPPGARRTLVFFADGRFSRAAFGLSKWSRAVGDEVHLRIHAEFVQERADP